uniref:Uncharacterized protein n=1 Tax=Tetraselmis sp. GSL018 TaxID=582737 RepID=A0A061RKC8_9CHLO
MAKREQDKVLRCFQPRADCSRGPGHSCIPTQLVLNAAARSSDIRANRPWLISSTKALDGFESASNA